MLCSHLPHLVAPRWGRGVAREAASPPRPTFYRGAGGVAGQNEQAGWGGAMVGEAEQRERRGQPLGRMLQWVGMGTGRLRQTWCCVALPKLRSFLKTIE
jgi:hypothetical protein